MRITRLSLTNFRSFKSAQTIEFAPLTLLFGPNSVGKSSVLMALFYVQQILAKGQCNPQRLDALGGKFVGGFQHLVHGKQLQETIAIRLEFDKQEKIGASYTYLTDLIGDQTEIHIDSPAAAAKTTAVEFEIAWSPQARTAYVASYKVWFDGEELAELSSDPGLKQPMITAINYLHPLLLPDNHDEWLRDRLDSQAEIHNALWHKVLALKGIDDPGHRAIAEGLPAPFADDEDAPLFTDDCFVSEFHQLLTESRLKFEQYDQHKTAIGAASSLLHAPIGFKGFAGALPLLGKPLKSTLSLDSEQQDVVVHESLSDLLVAPLDNLLSLLNDSLCIGPLRHIPDPTYQPNPYPEQGDWYTGKACWDSLSEKDMRRDDKINQWLGEDDKLNLGYQLVYKTERGQARYITPNLEIRSLQESTALNDWHDKMFMSDISYAEEVNKSQTSGSTAEPVFMEAMREQFVHNTPFEAAQQHFKKSRLTLWDKQNNIEVSAADVGVGVSQLLPLVVATFTRSKGLIACEQPELHVHPRVQVAIGDLLTQTKTGASFLIETHSEHLILRLLRRIRETTDEELEEGIQPVKPEDVAVIYLDAPQGRVVARRINIDQDGEFVQRWPSGFFSERRRELM